MAEYIWINGVCVKQNYLKHYLETGNFPNEEKKGAVYFGHKNFDHGDPGDLVYTSAGKNWIPPSVMKVGIPVFIAIEPANKEKLTNEEEEKKDE
jgi:hypothetical protein